MRTATLLGIVASLATAHAAHASLVRRLDGAELAAGSEAVVEGRVLSVASSWTADGRNLVTSVEVEVERSLAGGIASPTVRVLVPGGEVPEGRQIVVGMPDFAAGEQVRLYLRRSPIDPAAFRVLGGWQGKWRRTAIAGVPLFLPEVPPPNGMVWPPYMIPVEWYMNPVGSDDLTFEEAQTAVFAAFDAWQTVPCSTLTFAYAGYSELPVAIDGTNVVLWIESGWIYGEEAAGATSLWIPIEEERTADIAMNGEGFTWAVGPSGSLAPGTLDLQGVITHEIGHFSGVSHTQSAHDTMYYSWTPWQGQRTLSADDQRGLCAVYPQDVDGCAGPDDCAAGETCEPYEHGTLCTAPAEPIGAFCNYDHVECEGFCLFTAYNLSSGYCSRFCEENVDCPPDFHCADASAGGTTVRVCFEGAPWAPDAGPPDAEASVDAAAGFADASLPCTTTGCPAGQYCDESGLCTFDCHSSADCAGGATCSDDGRCVAQPAGCGCRLAAGGRFGGLAIVLLLGLPVIGRRRLRRPPC